MLFPQQELELQGRAQLHASWAGTFSDARGRLHSSKLLYGVNAPSFLLELEIRGEEDCQGNPPLYYYLESGSWERKRCALYTPNCTTAIHRVFGTSSYWFEGAGAVESGFANSDVPDWSDNLVNSSVFRWILAGLDCQLSPYIRCRVGKASKVGPHYVELKI
ncbi:hypothetical protein N7532_005505 [Penicillium argentinense]|uniref:Uncharacterized protein n=1 Tax=Penicillium argentinense TaxID=1131581 RepID=A0A9W9K9X1_9EURO|nr:uncharacterized protein N7532_005505 [Penicillium argentinense]KAJ5098504.1 hypothetical protein N7532_005505 [Penicillium argentinense]